MTNVAINGLGRIGRATLKIVMDTPDLNLVAANDIGASDSVEYLLKYDTVYGRYQREVRAADGALVVDGSRISVLAEPDPANLPWDDLGIDLWSWSAPGSSPAPKIWRSMFRPARRT